MALPKLYGAPAYARPPRPVSDADRPFDPDDMPLEAEQTSEERELAHELAARRYTGGSVGDPVRGREGQLGGRPFRLAAIASRIRGSRDSSAA